VLSVDVVIDHHPERTGYDAVIRDIRPSYGATSTCSPSTCARPTWSAAAARDRAALRIKSDTQLLGRETSRTTSPRSPTCTRCTAPR
jgi:hypothetical protein